MPRIGRFRGFCGFRGFRHGERGAVAAVLVVLLGAGVLLGTGALVVDVGQIYAEREQLQSGADAAAIALARTCAAAPAQGLSACLGTPPTTPYVEVRTATQLSDGRTVLPPTFASTLSGMANYAGRTVRACARAAYGTPTTLRSAAVTVSQCEWTALTAGGTNLAPPPNVGIPAPSAEGVIYLHDPHG